MASERDWLSTSRLMKAIVVIAWIIAYWLLMWRIDGAPLLGKFLRPDYWWLTDVGTGILLFFLLSLVYLEPPRALKPRTGLLLQIGIMIVPLLYIPTAATSQLSPNAVKKRLFESGRQDYKMGQASVFNFQRPDYPRNPSVLTLALAPESYESKQITTLGRVYRDDKLAPNTFFCYQLVMYCCAADAGPLGVLVEYDKANNLSSGQWVKVRGKVKISKNGDQRKTKIIAEKVEPIDPPKDQYLYP
ncbi:MAG: TIGR03943 family putative permease subunit [Desulfomonilaceae bacterium]